MPGIAEILQQVTSCLTISEIGSLPPIHGNISTLPVNRGITILERGSFMTISSQIGRLLDLVPYCGLTGNVCDRHALTFPLDTDGLHLL